MDIPDIKIRVLDERCKPIKAHPSDACYDLVARLDEPVDIWPGFIEKIPVGINVVMPDGWEALVYARSGLASREGIAPVNCVGVIDAHYRGEIIVPLTRSKHYIKTNTTTKYESSRKFTINPGDRIAQIAFRKIPEFTVTYLDKDAPIKRTDRNDNGFGSSGIQS